MPSFELPALFVDAVASVAAASTGIGRPVLVNRDPGPDELAVPLDASVALELVDPGPDGIDRASDTVLSLLTVEWEPGEDGTGALVLRFAGDGALRLEVETLSAQLRDVTKPYLAPSGHVPEH